MTEHVLVPIDLAHESSWSGALPRAVEVVRLKGDCDLTVMTVVPDIIAGLDWRYAIRGETGGSEEFDMEQMVADAEQRLQQIVAQHLPQGMKASTVARHGTIYEETCSACDLRWDCPTVSDKYPLRAP